MTEYAVTVTTHRLVDGWERATDSPTFYLKDQVQGIVSEAHAAQIITRWLLDAAPGIEVHAHAVAL